MILKRQQQKNRLGVGSTKAVQEGQLLTFGGVSNCPSIIAPFFGKWKEISMPKSRLKKRPDGLYQISVIIEEAGKRKRKYFYGKTQQEAKKKMLEYQQQREAGRSFEIVANEWQQKHWEEISPGTQVSYHPALNRALQAFSGRSIKDIVPLDIKRTLDVMAAQGYAHHSVAIYLSVLTQIFNHAIMMTDISDNPTATVSVPKGLKTSARDCPEEEQLAIIRKHVEDPFGLFPYMLLYTGLRRGEILALQWKDIDIGNRTISVTKAVTYARTGNQPEIKSTKTEAGKREIVLLDRLATKLFPLQQKPDDYLFGGEAPLTQSVFRTAWRKYCLNAGLWRWKKVQRIQNKKQTSVLVKEPSITPHQLRHAFATICFETGVDPKDAQQLLGHSKLEVTMDTYTHIRKKRHSHVAAKLNKAE